MRNYSFMGLSLVIRLACAAPFLIGGWLVVTRASGGWAAAGPALGGMLLFVVGAVIMAPTLAEWIAELTGSLFTSSEHAIAPAPMYGIADALRAKGDYEGALAYLDQIAHDHPQDLDAYVRMIDIAVVDLHDLSRAEALYHRGTHALEIHGDKAALTVMYRALSSRYKDPLHPTPVRPLSLHPKPRAPFAPRSSPATPPRDVR